MGGSTAPIASARQEGLSVRRSIEAAGHRIPEGIGYASLGVPAEGVATAGCILDPDAVTEAAVGLLGH